MWPFKKRNKRGIVEGLTDTDHRLTERNLDWARKMLIGKRNDPCIQAIRILLHKEYYDRTVAIAEINASEKDALVKLSGEIAGLGFFARGIDSIVE